jgi:hypothetical protein
MEKIVGHFEKKLLKAAFFIILLSLAGFLVFAYFYLLVPLEDINFISLFEKESSVYPGKILLTEKIVAGQEKRAETKTLEGVIAPDIFSVSKKETESPAEGERQTLSLDLTVNGKDGISYANFGDTLNYVLVYRNESGNDVENLEIKINTYSTSQNNKMLLNWSTLEGADGASVYGFQVSPELRRGTITWTSREISPFKKIAPGEEGQINFKINIKPFSEVSVWQAEKFEIASSASAIIGGTNGREGTGVVESNSVVLIVEKRE